MTHSTTQASPRDFPSFSAIVAAAGAGVRMRARRKKPFLLLDNVPILLHTLWRLRQARGCEGIVLAVHPEDFERQPGSWAESLKTDFGVTAIVAGGATRQASVLAALEATSPDVPLVLTHDAVRPLVRVEVIEAVAARANECGAAIAAAPAVATVKEVDADGFIRQTLPRERLWLAQTPQGFRRELLFEAHKRALDDGFVGTDDALLVERTGHRVAVVEDSPDNIKITTPEDLVIAEAILLWQRAAGIRGSELPPVRSTPD
jgi:2-C-methyl-D-erythritol 4-phosphate cytidylyltransferase